jgi:hypothetical protein
MIPELMFFSFHPLPLDRSESEKEDFLAHPPKLLAWVNVLSTFHLCRAHYLS